jgi:hypothetical protein
MFKIILNIKLSFIIEIIYCIECIKSNSLNLIISQLLIIIKKFLQ